MLLRRRGEVESALACREMLYNDLPPHQPFSVAFLRFQVVLILDPLSSIVLVLVVADTAVPQILFVNFAIYYYL
jgi:hypothetical protein